MDHLEAELFIKGCGGLRSKVNGRYALIPQEPEELLGKICPGPSCRLGRSRHRGEIGVAPTITLMDPLEDLRAFLNELPGPVLTITDVAQRMRAFEDEDYFSYPKEELQPGC